MEIAGYPHYENVCSNILAFFLDPEEPHGLGTLVLDALVCTGSIADAGGGIGGNVSVEREVSTDAGNRLDILIESDTHAILIENKILAGIGNPFADYTAYLNHRTNGDLLKYKFLLTLVSTHEGSKWGFKNLTYAEFVDQIRSMLGQYVSGADPRYLTIFLDFLTTLENLREGTRMNEDLIKLFSERTDDAENLFAEMMNFKDELRKKVRELGALIDVREYEHVRQYFYRERAKLFDDLGHDIRVSKDLLVAIDTVIDAEGWRSYIWPRQGDRSELAILLESLEIPFEEASILIPSTQNKRFVYSTRFGYSENLDRISPILQDLVDKLATVRAGAADFQLGSAAGDPGPF